MCFAVCVASGSNLAQRTANHVNDRARALHTRRGNVLPHLRNRSGYPTSTSGTSTTAEQLNMVGFSGTAERTGQSITLKYRFRNALDSRRVRGLSARVRI